VIKPVSSTSGSLPPTIARHLDQVCNQFERAWRGGTPRIEDFLAGVVEPERSALLRELVLLDIDYRRQREQTPRVEDYERFPELAVTWLAAAMSMPQPVEVDLGATQDGGDTEMILPDLRGRCIGDYELEGEIARGAMGVVYKARQKSLNRIVAVKMILAGRLASAQEVQRFRAEAESAAALDHPHIVPIYEVGSHEDLPYFSMKLIEGGHLGQRMQEFIGDFKAAARLIATVARAVHYAHQRGILHRDLKPANILLDSQRQPHVTDFGLAKRLGADAGQTHTGAVVGTPSYMSPEQAAGQSKGLTTAADVYALGAILYELLTGQPPFKAETPLKTLDRVVRDEPIPPRRLCATTPRDLEIISLKCLRKEPAGRYASAEKLAEDLERWQRGEPIEARPAGTVERGIKWMRRRPALAALTAVCLLAALALLGNWLHFTRQLQEENAATLQERDRVRQQAEEIQRQLESNRHALFTSQLLRIGLLRERDPDLGLQLLMDADSCPPAMRDFTWGMFYRLCRRERLSIQAARGKESILALAVTADGRMVASGGDRWAGEPPKVVGGVIKLWDGLTGRELANLPGHSKSISGLAFSPDGSLLASGSYDGTVIVWDVSNRNPLVTFKDGIVDEDRSFQFTADNRLLFAWNANVGFQDRDSLKRWDLTTKTERPLPFTVKDKDDAGVLAISPDGNLLAVAYLGHGGDGTDRIWDLNTGREIQQFKHRPTRRGGNTSMSLAFSPDSRILVSGLFHNGTLVLWDVMRGKIIKELWEEADDVLYLAFTRDGTNLFAEGIDSAKMWNLTSGEVSFRLRFHKGVPSRCALSADGKTLCFYPSGQEFTIWDLTQRPLASALEDLLNTRGRRLLCSNGTILAVDSGAKEGVRCCNLSSGTKQLVLGKGQAVRHAALSLDGHLLVTVAENSAIQAWELPSGKTRSLPFYPPLNGRCDCLAISSDGRRIAFLYHVRDAWELTVWDMPSGRPCFAIRGVSSFEPQSFSFLSFSPDGTMLAGKTDRLAVHVWNIETGTELLTLSVEEGEGRAGVFRSDGKMLALSCGRTIRLWDLAKNQECGCLRGHTKDVLSLSFSPDGRTLATGSADGIVRLWDVVFGLDHATLYGCKSGVDCVAFSADGRRLVAADTEGTVRVWEAAFPVPRED
jgi:WD40 repeat protein/tRNA A-37 threonylcarbamoyl transferase component Bud32